MTAIVAGLALLPLVVAGDIAGLEMLHPMGIVILGGLVTSTLVNLFVVPTLYLRLESRPEPEVRAAPATRGPAPATR